MKQLILVFAIFFVFLLAIIFRPKKIEVLQVKPFEEERKMLMEKYPEKKSYSLEEFDERNKALDDLFKRELEKYKKDEREKISGETGK